VPRQPRLDLGGVAQHIVQRGNDRQPSFFTDVDRGRYLLELRKLSRGWGCAIHAYVLMTNHVHLLAKPRERGAIGRLMQALGRRYVRFVNDRHCRTGTLWEGRYKACLVASDEHLLRCYRYIELNPVRAGMVPVPSDYHGRVIRPMPSALLSISSSHIRCTWRWGAHHRAPGGLSRPGR